MAGVRWRPALLLASTWSASVTGLQCWPTFALFVACCPKPETLDPDLRYCPVRDDDHVDEVRCCAPPVLDMVMKQFGHLSQEDVMRVMPGEDFLAVLSTLGDQLFRFVRDIAVLNVDAWRLASLAFAQHAMAQVDLLKDRALGMHTADSMHEIWRTSLGASRALNRAMFRVENFQQFLLSHLSHHQGEMLNGFDPEAVRELFQPLDEVYVAGMRTLDLVVYNLLPQSEVFFRPPITLTETPVVNLLVVSLGAWAKVGFTTMWTVLKRASCRLRVFVLGDIAGLDGWRSAVAELLEVDQESSDMLGRVVFEYIDYMNHPRFKAFLERYPTGCTWGDAGTAIVARVVCHEVLPRDVDRVISMDLGDIIVLDDVRELWDIGDAFEEQHLLAAAHAVSLHHVNGGLVLYDVRRMRERNFSDTVLRAVEDGLRADSAKPNFDAICLRDQSVINILHSFREAFGYTGASPVMLLPCRWSVFPVAEWQPHWNVPHAWLPEIKERRRYPGIISWDRVELYCPDDVDMLSSWAFVPMSEFSDEGTRQSRLRLWAFHEGRKTTRYCSEGRTVGGRCCKCGEAAALVHIAGDIKSWPAMQNFLRAHSPPWKQGPPDDAYATASSQKWWGGDTRVRRMLDHTEREAFLVARTLGLNARFKSCVTLRTQPYTAAAVTYHQLELTGSLPLELHVDTTAPRDIYMLIGIGGHSGLEIIFGSNHGTMTEVRMIRSSSGWAKKGELMQLPFRPAGWTESLDIPGEEPADVWTSFSLIIKKDTTLTIEFKQNEGVSFQAYLPEQVFWMLREPPLSISVASHSTEGKWGVCLGPPT
mmetsp:Transcript_63719/g.206934  ORF Transcript_63719/g.206934 Transcript_63719/m.206934 type:complete len:817 (-) Transcript_63719:919-3369(-)